MKRIKMKTSKLTRILISIVATALVVGSIALGATVLQSGSEEIQPVVLQFNNEEAINKLYFYESTGTLYTGEDGRTALSTTMTDPFSSCVEFPGTLIPEIDLASYPFVVIHANQGSDCSETTDLYWDSNADGSSQWEEFPMPTSGEWTKTVLDMGTRTYYNYVGDELLGSGAIQSENSDTVWQGDLTYLRFDFSKYLSTARTSLVEYIGFFPTKEAALAYDGAMPNDELATTAAEALSEEASVVYAQAETETIAKKYLQDTFVDKVATVCGDVKHSVVVKDITDYSVNVSGGTFTAKTWIYVGEGLQQSLLVTDVACRVEAKPAPVVVEFNSQDVVDAMSIYYDDETMESTFVDDETPHLSWTVSSSGWCDPMYLNFLQMSGQSDTFTYDAYPYMKILYRRNVSASKLSGERTELYIDSDANDSANNYAFDLYKLAEGEEPYWEALVADMRGTTAQFFQDGKETRTEEFIHYDTNKWTGNPVSTRLGVPIRFDFTRNGIAERTMDVAYVGFFASEAEAIAYPDVLDFQATADANKLREHCNFTGHNSLDTQEMAHAYAEEYIESLNFTSAYTLTPVEFTKPTLEAQGQYLFDVTFAETEVVRCTMTIDKQVEPVIYTFDNTSSIKNFAPTNNVKLSIEDGFMKMQSLYPSEADGFYTEAYYPNYASTFDVSTRRYFKAKYQLSGIADVPKDQMLTEIYYQLAGDSAYYWRDSYMVSAEMNGNTIEMIMDLGATDPASNRTWVKAGDGSYVAGMMSSNETIRYEGELTYFRFNPARVATAEDRTAYVQYMGFFGSLEEAQAYDGDQTAEERLEKAATALTANTLQIEWGDGNTKEKAFAKVLEMVQSDIGCTLENMQYIAPTESTKGKVTFDAVLVSGGIEKTVNATAEIGVLPEAVIWRFNDPDMLEDMVFGTNTEATIENNQLKMIHTYADSGEGFSFRVDTDTADEQFYLQNNPYIVMKYRRDGVGPVRISYSTDRYDNTTFYKNNGNLGFGPESGDWYTSIVDTSVENHELPLVRNYNHDDPSKNFNFYIPYALKQDAGYHTEQYKFKGLSKEFTFEMANFWGVERTCYIEYVGFFPTLDAALAYDEAYESAKSNTEVALRNYAGESISYYDGIDEPTAILKAAGLVDKLLLDDVNVEITTVGYNAPVANMKEGSYQFIATIKDNEERILYTTQTCTLTIGSTATRYEQVYMFTNPDFIKTIEGATASEDYSGMILGANPSFEYTFHAAEASISLDGYPRVSLGVVDGVGPIEMTLNDTYQFTTSGETELNGILDFVFDADTGYKVYLDGNEIYSATVSGLEDMMSVRMNKISFAFGGNSAKVQYMVFSPDTNVTHSTSATTLPDQLNQVNDIANAVNGSGDAFTKEKAMVRASELILKDAAEDVKVAKTSIVDFVAPTTKSAGSYTCDVWVSYGEEHATYYKKVCVSATINAQPTEPKMLRLDETFPDRLWWLQNLTLTYEDGVIHTETINSSAEDAFFEFPITEGIYLPDYPIMSMKFRRTGEQAGATGDTQIYFWSDETQGNPSMQCSLGSSDLLGDGWVTAIIDMNEGLITLYDMSQERVYSTATITGSLNKWIGNMTSMRITMARNITAARTADIAYFGFFPTQEAAEDYMGGLYLNDYTTFTGRETAQVKKDLEKTPLTIEMAVRIDKKQSMPLISNKSENNGDTYFALEVTDEGKASLIYGDQVVTTSESICTGSWVYLTAIVSDDTAEIYVNGIQQASAAIDIDTSEISLKAPMLAGDYLNDRYFVGDMANVKLYSIAKASDAATQCDYKMPIVLEDNMIAGWALDKLATDNTYAELGEEYTLELSRNFTKTGHEFIGSDYLTTKQDLAEAPKTFETWMRVSKAQLSGTYTLISNSDLSVQVVDGQIVANYNGTEVLRTSKLALETNQWTHIAITFDDVANIYVNGELRDKGTVAVDSTDLSVDCVYIGVTKETSQDMFKGHLSDIRLWSDVRTFEEITDMMQGYPASTEEGLLASWRLDTHNYLDYTDYSSNNNTATLYSETWYKLDKGVQGDYTIIHLGDTQNSTGYGGEVKYLQMMDWISNNVDNLNMKYLTHAGDVTQICTLQQWDTAKQGFDMIEGKLPYGIALGNHDYAAPSHGMGTERRDDRFFNQKFPYAAYSENTWFGGAFEPGSRTNIYNCVTVNEGTDKEVQYLFFSLEYGPRDAVLDWVSDVLKANPKKKAIITTHCYFETDGTLEYKDAHQGGYDFKDANEGIDIWNKILRKHKNVVMLTCGHSQGTQTQQKVNQNVFGNDVIQILADPSAIGGFPSKESLIFIMAFTDEGTMHTYYYSADRDLYYGTVNECTYDMSGVLFDEAE